MIHTLVPWRTLTRGAIPPLKVCRRDLVLGEIIVPVGETLDPELLPMQIRAQRLRQFYEMRLLEPVSPQPNAQQYYREQFVRAHGGAVPISPIQPVASRIVADLPAIEVPVAESESLDPAARRKPKGGR